MTLADELMGRRPLVPLSPGRIVSHADPAEPGDMPLLTREEILEWANGRFTSHDVSQVFGVSIKLAAAHLGRMYEKGLLDRVGQEHTVGRPLWIWRKCEPLSPAAAAKRKHFG